MSSARRNVMVGVVVLGAMAIFAWMILRFGAKVAQPFSPDRQPIHFTANRADGLAEGAAIFYRGVIVGRVGRVALADDHLHVEIQGDLDQRLHLPTNLTGVIRPSSALGGNANLSLELTGVKPEGELQPDATLPADYSGNGLIPREVTDLADALRQEVDEFRRQNVIGNVNDRVKQLGDMLQNINNVLGDATVQHDLRETLAALHESSLNARQATANFTKLTTQASDTIARADTHVNQLSSQLSGELVRMNDVLKNVQDIALKLNKGQGTAGLLVNDPKLYQGLVDSAAQLTLTVGDLHRLVQQWEQEGVTLRVR